MPIRIFHNKKVRIIVSSLFIVAVCFFLWRDYREEIKVEQAFNSFVENRNFTRVEIESHSKDHSLESHVLTQKKMDELWNIIANAKPGSGPRKVYDIHISLHFFQPDNTRVTVRLRKDINSDFVRVSFYLPRKAGYSLIGEDVEGKIEELVGNVAQ